MDDLHMRIYDAYWKQTEFGVKCPLISSDVLDDQLDNNIGYKISEKLIERKI